MSNFCKDPSGKDSHKRHLSYIIAGALIFGFFVSMLMSVLGKMPWRFFIEEFFILSGLVGAIITGTAISDALHKKTSNDSG
jgi:hypothetical protein